MSFVAQIPRLARLDHLTTRSTERIKALELRGQ
jgi:hypothetical protein